MNLISIAVIALQYLELIKLQLEPKGLYPVSNVPVPDELVMMQVDDHVRMGLIHSRLVAFQGFSKNYLSILMVLLFQHPLYYRFFLLFLSWI